MNDEKDFIIDDLLGLNSSEEEAAKEIIATSQNASLEEIQNKIIERMKQNHIIDQEINTATLDPKNELFVSIIKENVNFCVHELKEVNETMEKISAQKNSEMFFRKSENIKLLSKYMAKMASVNQKTIDLLILLLGANGKISDEYETILATIDELGELNHGEAEVLNYLLKVKKMVYEIRDNEEKLKQVVEDNKITKDIVVKAEEAIKQEIEESEKSRKLINSKCNRLQKRIAQNNLYIGICLLIIIALTIFIGLKFYVL